MDGYVYGEQPDDLSITKLNTNENPYPPSPDVEKALQTFRVSDLRRYPDATARRLRTVIAELHGLTPDQVVVTNGGDEGLRMLATACLDKSRNLVAVEPSYSLYPVIAAIQNSTYVPIDLDADFGLPVDLGESCNRANASMVFVTNPNAPSGVLAGLEAIHRLLETFKGVVLIDEAYVDFVSQDVNYDLVPLLGQFSNLVLLRTFSKGYSLAGLRLGYLLASREFVKVLSTKVRDSYNIGALEQRVGQAALEDIAYARECWEKVREDRERLRESLLNLGFDVPESQSNFLLPGLKSGESARSLFEALAQRKILVRYFDQPRLRNRLRITVGNSEQNAHLIATLNELTHC